MINNQDFRGIGESRKLTDLQSFEDGLRVEPAQECSLGSLVEDGEPVLVQVIRDHSQHVDRVPDGLELNLGPLQRIEQSLEVSNSLWKEILVNAHLNLFFLGEE